MANWKKVLVSGSNIDVNQISGSNLFLTDVTNKPTAATQGNFVLVLNSTGSVSALSQASLEGASQTFLVGAGVDTPVSFNANQDALVFTTASTHGFSFSVTLNEDETAHTASIQLTTPQDLRTSATPNFANLDIGANGAGGGSIAAGPSGTSGKITITDTAFEAIVNERKGFKVQAAGSDTDSETLNVNFNFEEGGAVSKPLIFKIDGGPDNISTIAGVAQTGSLTRDIFVITGSQIGIGKAMDDIHANAKLHISGGDLVVQQGAITASGTPVIPIATASTSHVAMFDSDSKGVTSIAISDFFSTSTAQTAMSGAFTNISASFASNIDTNASDITTLTTNISNNDTDISTLQTSASKGIRFQVGEGLVGDAGRSIPLTETASFVGTANEVFITHSSENSPSESVFTFGLPDDVIIQSNLTVSESLTVLGSEGITTTNITASGNISASGNLTVTGDVTLDGTLSFAGLSFIENQAQVLSGSAIFGSGSNGNEATVNSHQFSGSLLITGSQIELNNGNLNINSGSININDVGGITVQQGDIVLSDGDLTVTEITASGIISSSNHLFASLSLANKDQVVVYDTSTGQFFHTASSALSVELVLGEPADGNYENDGLLPFQTDGTTTINDAIDDINEVLAGLAPPAAPALAGIGSVVPAGGVTQMKAGNLSYGTSIAINSLTASVNPGGLSNPSNDIGAVDINGEYIPYNSATDDDLLDGTDAVANVRLGIINCTSTAPSFRNITGTLNDHVAASAGTFVNHPDNAFGKGNQGVLHLYVNNNTTPIHTQSLSGSMDAIGDSLNPNSSGFIDLSATESAHFTATGQPLTIFTHRSGGFQVGAADQINGWNYARIEHIIDGTVNSTTYATWVNESNVEDIDDTAETLTFTTESDVKVLSGVHYLTNGGYSGKYKTKAENAYKNVYSSATDAIQVGLGAVGDDNHILDRLEITSSLGQKNEVINGTSTTISNSQPSLNTTAGSYSSSLLITASFKVDSADNVAIACPNNEVFINISGGSTRSRILHPTKGTTNLTTKSNNGVTGVLYDNRSHSDGDLLETFVTESVGRLRSASYDNQADTKAAIGSYPGSASLDTSGVNKGGLLIVPVNLDSDPSAASTVSNTGQGSLIYPTKGLDNYNSSTLLKPGSITQPNYTSLTGNRFYLRAFKNNTDSNQANIFITMQGSGNINTTLSSTQFQLNLRYPGFTSYLDLAQPLDSTQDLQTEGHGCRVGSLGNGGALTDSGVINKFTFDNSGFGSIFLDKDVLVCRVVYSNAFTGYIKKIQISF